MVDTEPASVLWTLKRTGEEPRFLMVIDMQRAGNFTADAFDLRGLMVEHCIGIPAAGPGRLLDDPNRYVKVP